MATNTLHHFYLRRGRALLQCLFIISLNFTERVTSDPVRLKKMSEKKIQNVQMIGLKNFRFCLYTLHRLYLPRTNRNLFMSNAACILLAFLARLPNTEEMARQSKPNTSDESILRYCLSTKTFGYLSSHSFNVATVSCVNLTSQFPTW